MEKIKEPKLRVIEVCKEEKRLIDFIRELGYGEISIKVRGGRPYQIVEPKKSILLGDNSFFHSGKSECLSHEDED